MTARPSLVPALLAIVLLGSAGQPASAQQSSLPALAPTTGSPLATTAPIAATPSTLPPSGTAAHRAEVQCTGGQIEVRAENSSLNGILRSISRCTGMRISGGVAEQRVYGNYGPAAPATVLATLIDGTGSNMLLKESSGDQPEELILSPRTGGPTPPPPSSYNEAEEQQPVAQSAPVRGQPYVHPDQVLPGSQRASRGYAPGGQTPVPQANNNSVVTSPQPIPQPINNVNGSPSNTSPTASTYPTTNSVPLDALRTPSTTPSIDGIVDAPNPPPAGSDTAAALNGAPRGTPGTTNINPGATGQTSTPGATNTTVPATSTSQTNQGSDLTPEQIFQQLQQRQQRQQQQQQQQDTPQ